MTKTEPTNEERAMKAVAEILAGRYDGHLGKLAEAAAKRLNEEVGPRLCWKLRLDGDEWTEDTVTAGELAFAERTLSTASRRVSYMQLNPMGSMDHRLALIVAHLVKIGGLKATDAVARAEKITPAEMRDVVDVYEVTDAPKGDPDASTSS